MKNNSIKERNLVAAEELFKNMVLDNQKLEEGNKLFNWSKFKTRDTIYSVSFFTDIYFKEDYVKIYSIKHFYKVFGTKIYYKDIVSIDFDGRSCIVYYKNKKFKFYSSFEGYSLLVFNSRWY